MIHPAVAKYRLTSALLSIELSRIGSHHFIEMPAGTILEYREANRNLVEVTYEGHTLLVFLNDLYQRGERVDPYQSKTAKG